MRSEEPAGRDKSSVLLRKYDGIGRRIGFAGERERKRLRIGVPIHIGPHAMLNAVSGNEILGQSYPASLCDGYAFDDPRLVVRSSCKAVLHLTYYVPVVLGNQWGVAQAAFGGVWRAKPHSARFGGDRPNARNDDGIPACRFKTITVIRMVDVAYA